MAEILFEELFPELGCPVPTPSRPSDWFKDIPKYSRDEGSDQSRYFGKVPTIRKCPAVEDAMFMGYTLFTPCDFIIDARGEEIKWSYPKELTEQTNIGQTGLYPLVGHDVEGTQGYMDAWGFHPQTLKWNPYWSVKTPEGYSSLFTHPLHREDLPFYSVSGIVDTDVFPTYQNFAFFVKQGFSGIIPRGTPMLQVLPYKREDWSMETKQFNMFDLHKQRIQIATTFTNAYKKIFWTRKKYK